VAAITAAMLFCTKCGTLVEETFAFCVQCGVKIVRDQNLQGSAASGSTLHGNSEREIIESYFLSGYEYQSIICLLEKYHGICISMSTLQRRLSMYGLKRRDLLKEGDDNKLIEIMKEELDGPSCVSGYRALWHTLKIKYGICVPRAEVQRLLKELDPVGTEERSRRKLKRREYSSPGPNECWHVDGYDKLKPFGFPIHGAIDGYSRRVLWLKVCRSNNNPAKVASYFYDCVNELGGCPRLVRTDPGTENVVIASLQCYLRANHVDDLAGDKAHRYGGSTGNQRIECWWSHLKRSRTSWWINFFKDLTDTGVLLDGNIYQRECLWFCFNHLIQQDLNFVAMHWNTHYIRRSRHDTISGKPDELFFLPEASGGEDQLQPVTEDHMREAVSQCEHPNEDNEYQDYFKYVCEHKSLFKPEHWRDALSLFKYILTLHY